MSKGLIIFIKNPEKGKVKTRLAASVGEEKALRIYHELLNHTRKVTSAIDARRYLYYSSFIDEQDDWSMEDFEKRLQKGASLGESMSRAFEESFSAGGKVVIIGSDCPLLTPDIVEQAFQALDSNHFVIGPALDGGYYLLGMQEYLPFVFENIPWSTGEVLKLTLEKIQVQSMTCHILEALPDIDYEEDWEKYGWELGL